MDKLVELQNNAQLTLSEVKAVAAKRPPESGESAESPEAGPAALSAADFQEALGQLSAELRREYGARVEVHVDDEQKIIVRITSKDGKRVFRQLPPESILRFRANMKETRGFLGDWTA
jgi:uncharacterized FlaG/YvyC family protein